MENTVEVKEIEKVEDILPGYIPLPCNKTMAIPPNGDLGCGNLNCEHNYKGLCGIGRGGGC